MELNHQYAHPTEHVKWFSGGGGGGGGAADIFNS